MHLLLFVIIWGLKLNAVFLTFLLQIEFFFLQVCMREREREREREKNGKQRVRKKEKKMSCFTFEFVGLVVTVC